MKAEGVPVATTVKVTLVPAATVWLAGWVVMVGPAELATTLLPLSFRPPVQSPPPGPPQRIDGARAGKGDGGVKRQKADAAGAEELRAPGKADAGVRNIIAQDLIVVADRDGAGRGVPEDAVIAAPVGAGIDQVTVELTAVVRLVPIWKTQNTLFLPWASRTRAPVWVAAPFHL